MWVDLVKGGKQYKLLKGNKAEQEGDKLREEILEILPDGSTNCYKACIGKQ